MDKYLPEILKEFNTVIIPEIGALTVTNPNSGELMFMPFLKHNDGKFAAYIAEKEGIESQEAANMLAKFIREMQAKLDQGDSYRIFKFGTFTKETDGSIVFTQWQDSDELNGGENEAPSAPEEPVEPLIESQPEESIEPPVSVEVTVEESLLDDKTETIENSEEPEVMVPEALAQKEYNIAEKEELAKNIEKLEKLRKQKETMSVRKRRTPAFWVIIGLVIIVSAGAVYVGFNFSEFRQHIPFLAAYEKVEKKQDHLEQMKELLGEGKSKDKEKAKEETDQKPVEDSEVASLENTEQVPEKKVAPIVEPKEIPRETNGLNFHLVAGVFSVPENARRLADKLSAAGYPASVVIRGTQHFVKIQSFSSKAEAQRAISGVRNDAPKVWLYSGNLD